MRKSSKSRSSTTSSRGTDSSESKITVYKRLTIQKKIHDHLQGRATMDTGEVESLLETLNKMACLSLEQRKHASTTRKLLEMIQDQLTLNASVRYSLRSRATQSPSGAESMDDKDSRTPSNVIKLKLGDGPVDDTPPSQFPSELLTNNEFVYTTEHVEEVCMEQITSSQLEIERIIADCSGQEEETMNSDVNKLDESVPMESEYNVITSTNESDSLMEFRAEMNQDETGTDPPYLAGFRLISQEIWHVSPSPDVNDATEVVPPPLDRQKSTVQSLVFPSTSQSSQLVSLDLLTSGASWQEADVRVSEAVNYDVNEMNEVISLGDTTVDDLFGVTSTNKSSGEDRRVATPGQGSFVFDLNVSPSSVDVVEETPRETQQEPARRTPLKRKSDETDDVIEETPHHVPPAPLKKKHLVEDQDINVNAQSQSFLNYRTTQDIPSSTESCTILPPVGDSRDNVVLIDGTVPTEEEPPSFVEKRQKLQEAVMKKRHKYRDRWDRMSLAERVSEKFIRKFGVRIFHDPVDALKRIEYQPNFDVFHSKRLTPNELRHVLESMADTVKALDEALTSAVREHVRKSLYEAENIPSSRQSDSDSSSSDEEHQAVTDRKLIEECMLKSRMELSKFLPEVAGGWEIDGVEAYRRRVREELEEQDRNLDREELLENLIGRMEDLDWLKE